MLKQQKSQKATVKAGLSMPLSTPVSVTHCGVAGSSSLDVGEYESGVARSRNASPTHNYYRQDRSVVTVRGNCIDYCHRDSNLIPPPHNNTESSDEAGIRTTSTIL